MKPDLSLARSTLQRKFGLDDFRDGQSAVIERLLDGKNTAAIFPTGGGKSLCYQLPAILFENLTIVVSPLMALMKDQVDALQGRGICAVRLDSSLSPAESQQAMRLLRDGSAKMLYVAPERFFNERFRSLLSDFRISMFAVDEAHCISQWGHNFRPDYLKLARIARELHSERVVALTATATPAVAKDICREFEIEPDDCVRTDFFRPNLHLRFMKVTQQTAVDELIAKIEQRQRGATLVYVSLQQTTVDVAAKLAERELPARPYHAGLPDSLRRETQDWFMQSESPIVVATIAFGMGIDKPDIRYVYHLNPSKSLENYAQEIGRAGRDGLPAVCQTLLNPDDRIVLENFSHGDVPAIESVQNLCDFIAHQPDRFYISQYALARQFDIRDLVIRTLLTYLELDGYLAGIGPRYDQYRFKLLTSLESIVQNTPTERRKIMRDVLAMSVKKKIWFTVDVTKTIDRVGCTRNEAVAVLEQLSERGLVELKVKGLMHGYQRIKSIEKPRVLGRRFAKALLKREGAEIERIDQLYDLMTSGDCQSAQLAKHFGQRRVRDCSKCSACIGNAIGKLDPPQTRSLGTSVWTTISNLAANQPDLLGKTRQQARFLCGLNSPALFSARLTRHDFYGCCSRIPFRKVLELLEQGP
jgi:ATP-dependent DNA helicase RecQ